MKLFWNGIIRAWTWFVIWDFILTSTSIDSIRFLLEGEHELAVWLIQYDTGNNTSSSKGGNDIGDERYVVDLMMVTATFPSCRQHKPFPESVTNIDVAFIHRPHTKIGISWSSRLKSGSLCSKIRNREEINFQNLIF